MNNISSLEPAIDPNNRMGFLLDWEVTKKCNLDCSYCMENGHDNSTTHPDLSSCLTTIDFMLEYVNLYMKHKPKGIRNVVLNVYGGESLHHPDIVEILKNVHEKYQQYKDEWHLTITTTTNAIVSPSKLQKIIPYIDMFMVSYHPEQTPKQAQQFKDNLLHISSANKRQKCILLLSNIDEAFKKSLNMVKWLTAHNIKYMPKLIDGHDPLINSERLYTQEQIKWFNKVIKDNTFGTATVIRSDESKALTENGRTCCGGRQFCSDQNYKQRDFYINNSFKGWYCSVNMFFLHIKQYTGEVYYNKDCGVNYDGSIGPMGYLSNTTSIIDTLRTNLTSDTAPIIQCKKSKCLCGMCAPKAKTLELYNEVIKKYKSERINNE